MKHLVLGASGQLGHDLLEAFRERYPAEEVVPATHQQIEISDENAVRKLLGDVRPDVVINTAAYSQVDACEDDPNLAFSLNAVAPLYLARASESIGATLVQFSSDYVFDGAKRVPYTEQDAAKPISLYGMSRLAGENIVQLYSSKALVIRTCGLYGVAGRHSKGGNFVETMLRLAGSGKPLSVVNDQVVTPTSTRELAQRLIPLILEKRYGLFHMTNAGSCTWFEFAQEIFRISGLDPKLSPVTSAEFGARARRPAFSVLENAALRNAGHQEFGPWQQALAQYISQR